MRYPFDTAPEYIAAVTGQIRWKAAHAAVAQELETHLEEQTSANLAAGMDEPQAVDAAIQSMGDPMLLGESFDQVHRPRADWLALGAVLLVLAFSFALQVFLLFSVSVTSAGAFQYFAYTGYDASIGQEIITLSVRYLAAIGLFLVVYFGDYTRLNTMWVLLWAGPGITAIEVLFGPQFDGAYKVLDYFVPLLPVYFGVMVYRQRGKGLLGVAKCGMLYFAYAVCCLMVPSMTAFLLLTLTGLVVLTVAVHAGWLGGSKWQNYALFGVPSLLVLSWVLYLLFLSPRTQHYFVSIASHGLHLRLAWQSLLWGGANGTAYYAASPRSLLLFLAQQYGLWVSVLVPLAIGLLLFALVRLTRKQSNFYARILTLSALLPLLLYTTISLASSFGLYVYADIELPFFAEGRVPLLALVFYVGVILSANRRGSCVSDSLLQAKTKPPKGRVLRYQDGKIGFENSPQT